MTDLTNCCLQDLCLLLLFGDQAVSVLAETKSHSVNHSDTSAHHKKINNTSAMFAHTNEGTIVCAKARRPRLTRQSASCAIITHCCCRCLLLAGCLRWATERVFGGHRWTMVKGWGAKSVGGVFGSGPTVPKTGHVPKRQTKRVSRCWSGQESSQSDLEWRSWRCKRT